MKKKILIIDDDDNMRIAIKRLLSFEKDYEIDEAYDGNVAEAKVKEFLPDLVILDIKMPGKDGYAVCLDLRKNPDFNHIKIIGITGFSGKTGEAIMRALGADSFFEKPFDNDKFVNEIKRLLKDD